VIFDISRKGLLKIHIHKLRVAFVHGEWEKKEVFPLKETEINDKSI
jgi:hypothetical protein